MVTKKDIPATKPKPSPKKVAKSKPVPKAVEPPVAPVKTVEKVAENPEEKKVEIEVGIPPITD